MQWKWHPDDLRLLSQCFRKTQSSVSNPSRNAEAALSEVANRAKYGLAVLRFVAEPSVDEQIRLSAAMNFKNHVRAHWDLQPNDPARIIIGDSEKEEIKSLIVTVMVCAPPKIQAQLSEALTIIGKHDFPQAWPDLLPKFYGHLETFNSLFKKFRYQFKTNDLLLDLKYCVDNYAEPLLEVFKWNSANIDHAVDSGANASTLQGYIESQTVCCSIFYSLNCIELQKLFEDHMDEWMIEFKKYLKNKYSAVEDSGDVGLALVDELRAAVCENISLYVQKEDETFQDHLDEFLEALWPLLMVVSSSSKRERLTVAAIKFFTIVSTSVLHTFFAREDRLHQIFQDVVIPNVMLSDKDEVLFEQNYVEFIRRDMEGSALDTRRRIPGELLERIAMNYKERVTKKASSLIQTLLDSFSQNEEANWKFKDCAIHLVISLATERAGSTSLFTDREEFFVSYIDQELRSKYGNPMLKASALKFFTMFRNQISIPDVVALFPYVMELLSSDSNVVRSYAAICIEKILMVKDEGGRSIYTISDIPRSLINFLFDALAMPESEENQYVMKCIMRVLGVVDVTRVAVPCIRSLVTVLNRVCVNPKNPIFNHYTFESVAGLIRRACEQDPSIISEVEGILLPVLRAILQENVSEFFPYAFQLLAIFVEMNRSPLPGCYKEFFTKLLLPKAWDKSANVPALVRLLQAFLHTG